MGTISNGILGGFSGKVGTVIGSNWKKIDYMRSRPRKSSAAATTAQLTQQSRFSLMMKFLRLFGNFFDKSFTADGVTGANAALSYNLPHSITGAYPAFEIDFSKVCLSHGNLIKIRNAMSKPGIAGKVQFTWDDNSGRAEATASDNAVLVVYDPISKEVIYDEKGAKRSEGTAALDTPEFSGLTVETWITFISADGKKVQDSIYTGKVTVV